MNVFQKLNVPLVVVTVCLVAAGAVANHYYQAASAHDGKVESLLTQQEQILLSVLDSLRQTSAVDTQFGGIVEDCDTSGRAALDTLLGDIASLSYGELQRLQSLFQQCGDFFAVQRGLKSSRLTIEVAHFETILTTFDALPENDAPSRLSRWEEIAALEAESSNLSMQLVNLQKNIIDALLTGASAQSEEVARFLTAAQEARQNLLFNSQESRRLREELAS